MLKTNTKRVFRAALLNFWRRGFVTASSVLMMTVTLFTLGVVLFTGLILSTTLQNLREKADISVYFTTSAADQDIQSFVESIKSLPQVSSVTLYSKEDELAAFQARHQNDELTLQALQELGGNPFGAMLEIRAKDISQYDAIAQYLKSGEALGGAPLPSSIVDKVNYFDDTQRAAIERLASITSSAQTIGFIIILILALTTIAISFNTVRLAIYTSRDEISVMQLVGAARGYVRAPFMIETMLYGVVAGLLTLLFFYPLTYWLGSATENFFGGINVFSYYVSHFPILFVLFVGGGVVLGAIASFLAVRRYLKV